MLQGIKKVASKLWKLTKIAIALTVIIAAFSAFIIYKIEKNTYDRTPSEMIVKLTAAGGFLPPYVEVMGWDGIIEYKSYWINSLQIYASSDACKALIIVLDSPGGGATVSDELAMAVEDFKMANPQKPIIFYTREIMASGAYMIAVSGDYIFAQKGAIVGSIGVILEHTDLSGLFQKIGIKITPYTTGKHKDMFGNRQLDPEEKQIVANLLDETYQNFKDHVLEHRGKTIKYLSNNFDSSWTVMTDGRIFTAKQSEANGLTDGTFRDLDEVITHVKMMIGDPTIKVLTGHFTYRGEVYTIPNTKAKDQIKQKLLSILSLNPTSAQLMTIWRP